MWLLSKSKENKLCYSYYHPIPKVVTPQYSNLS